MRRLLKLTLMMALTFCMLSSVILTASAEGTVTYSGNSGKFIFAPGSEHSPTDLFDGFKGVMPGDTRTQKITINNKANNEVKVYIYMRALGAQEGSEEFLSQLNMTVDVVDGDRMFKAPANEKDGLADWYCLGLVYSGGKVDLDVKLEVPITMGNEFQNAIGVLDWEFKVEEFPVEPDDPKPPGTGDDNSLYVYGGLCLVSAVVIFFILVAKRRKDDEEEVAQ